MQRHLQTQTARTGRAVVFSTWLTVISLIPISGCTHLRSPEETQGSANYPRDNPTPTHKVIIEGTVSSTIHLKMNAAYEGKISADCWKSPLYSAGEVEGTATPVRRTVPVVLTADGEHFRGQFFVDQFLPGKCGWHLYTISAVLSKDQLPEERVVIAQAMDTAIYVDRQYLNSPESPSFVHVKYVGASSRLQLVLKTHEKSLLWIDDATHHIETHILGDTAQ